MTSRRISLSKRTAAAAPEPGTEPGTGPAVPLGKGRPTPKRSEAQRRRGGPVPPPPATRREAARRMREQQAAERKTARAGGPQARLLPRDAGPVRAYVRDLVDSRRNVAVIMLPVALLYVLTSFTRDTDLMALAMRLFTFALLLVIADSLIIAFTVRSRVRSEFPDDTKRGHVAYGLLRSTVFRRLRMPPARVRPRPMFRR